MGLEIAVGRQTIVTASQSIFTASGVVHQLLADAERSFGVDRSSILPRIDARMQDSSDNCAKMI